MRKFCQLDAEWESNFLVFSQILRFSRSSKMWYIIYGIQFGFHRVVTQNFVLLTFFFSDFRLFFLCRPIPRGDCRIYSQSYRISFSPFPRTFQHLSTTTRRKSCIHYTLCVDGVAGVSVYRVFSVKARRLNILKAYVVVRLCAIRP